MSKTEQVTAVHEAGHAIVDHVLGFPVVAITIIPDERTLGQCSYHNGERHGEHHHQEEAIALFAGHAAAQLFYSDAASVCGHKGDYRRAATLTGCGMNPKLIERTWMPQQPTKRYIDALRRAEKLVREYRSAITILARWLLVEKQIRDPLAIERLLSHLTVESI